MSRERDDGVGTCVHRWERAADYERGNGSHVFRCAWCHTFGWRPSVRRNRTAPPDPVRVYGGKRQELLARFVPLVESRVTARPMSARRGAHGGYVPPGSGGRR